MNIENSNLLADVDKVTPLKSWLVDYVGRDYSSELSRAEAESGQKIEWDGSVTVEMVVELVAKEFPEFLMAIAEENFIRGYRQAMADVHIDIVGRPEEE
jgi:hypothetical protein